jgi:calcineurin-like phosphoesterase family protein
MTTWFTSDTHFGHDAIRRLADRPFASTDAMDKVLVQRWNAVVQPTDTVWHLGDFSHKSAKSVPAYRQRLNGTIHLIAGNHDVQIRRDHPDLFASIQDMAEVTLAGKTIILCHYPLREWDKAWRGAWHLHGHVHGRLDSEPHGRSLDVGVDSHDFSPLNAAQIGALLSGRSNPFARDTEDERVRLAKLRRAEQPAPTPDTDVTS